MSSVQSCIFMSNTYNQNGVLEKKIKFTEAHAHGTFRTYMQARSTRHESITFSWESDL